jgi:hypothetical protein
MFGVRQPTCANDTKEQVEVPTHLSRPKCERLCARRFHRPRHDPRRTGFPATQSDSKPDFRSPAAPRDGKVLFRVLISSEPDSAKGSPGFPCRRRG